MIISGSVVKYGDNVNTDVIIPGKYLVLTDPKELAKHAMEGIDPNFPPEKGDKLIIVAGKNFGCGSSREQAAIALKHAGVRCVIAESLARIFYRNAINIGLPVLQCDGISNFAEKGDRITVDFERGEIRKPSEDSVLKANPLPSFILEIIEDGGLIPHLRKVVRCTR
ncbi:MAG: 3-isopropylmalate dehydratase small subunit [Candidatus Bathyarchaeia archaeon]